MGFQPMFMSPWIISWRSLYLSPTIANLLLQLRVCWQVGSICWIAWLWAGSSVVLPSTLWLLDINVACLSSWYHDHTPSFCHYVATLTGLKWHPPCPCCISWIGGSMSWCLFSVPQAHPTYAAWTLSSCPSSPLAQCSVADPSLCKTITASLPWDLVCFTKGGDVKPYATRPLYILTWHFFVMQSFTNNGQLGLTGCQLLRMINMSY